ncbi:MAG: hypothetical protein ACRD21_19390 [Vicinamibacteria bacterium]
MSSLEPPQRPVQELGGGEIWDANRIIERLGLKPSQYGFQMLHGVEPMLRRIVRDQGRRLRVAVPFGPSWYPYSIPGCGTRPSPGTC